MSPLYLPMAFPILPSLRERRQAVRVSALCLRQELQKQETVTTGDDPSSKVSPDDNVAEDVSRSHGEQDATTIGDNPADSKVSPDGDVAEDLSKNDGDQELTTTGGNPADSKPSPDNDIAEDLSRDYGEHEAISTGGNPANQAFPNNDIPNENQAQEVSNTEGNKPPGQGTGRNEAPDGDGDGQVALLLAADVPTSTRSPSSTLVWLMVVQAQFLAVLSLVDSVGSEHSWLSDFLEHLR